MAKTLEELDAELFGESIQASAPRSPTTPSVSSLDAELFGSDRSEFGAGLSAGIDQTQGLGYGAAGLVGDLVGSETLSEWGREGYQRNMAEAAENAPAVRFTEIDGLGDAGTWAAYTFGNLIPTMATLAATGGAGGMAGKYAVRKGVESALKRGAAGQAARLSGQGVKWGAGAGAGIGSTALEGGGIHQEIIDETGQVRPGVALGFGALAGSFDAIPIVSLLHRMGVGKKAVADIASDMVKQGLVKKVATEAGIQAVFEGSTEALQEVINKSALKWVESHRDIFTEEHIQEFIDAAAAGGLMGLTMGGAGGAVSHYRTRPPDEDEPPPSEPESALEDASRYRERIEATEERIRIEDDPNRPGPGGIDVARPDEEIDLSGGVFADEIEMSGPAMDPEQQLFREETNLLRRRIREKMDALRRPDFPRATETGEMDLAPDESIDLSGPVPQETPVPEWDPITDVTGQRPPPDGPDDSDSGPPGAGGIAVEYVDELDQAAHQAATSPLNETPEPTPSQIDSGNYRKGHVRISGLDISVENPRGSTRSGTKQNGETWSTTMQDHYGYLRGVQGADKDHVDVFLTDQAQDENLPVFVVDQVNPETGAFDEIKVVLGARNAQEAEQVYNRNYEQGWQGLGALHQTTLEDFKEWTKSDDTTKPFAEARTARQTVLARVPDLVADEGSVPESSEQELSGLRREGDRSVPEMERQLPGVLGRRGAETSPETDAGQDQQQRELRTRQRQVDDAEPAGTESTGQRVVGARREADDSRRLGERDRDSRVVDQGQDTAVRVERGEGVDDSDRSTAEEQPVSGVQRGAQADERVGEGVESGVPEVPEPTRQGVVRREGDRDTDVAEAPRETSPDSDEETDTSETYPQDRQDLRLEGGEVAQPEALAEGRVQEGREVTRATRREFWEKISRNARAEALNRIYDDRDGTTTVRLSRVSEALYNEVLSALERLVLMGMPIEIAKLPTQFAMVSGTKPNVGGTLYTGFDPRTGALTVNTVGVTDHVLGLSAGGSEKSRADLYETLAHEIGHVMDKAHGPASQIEPEHLRGAGYTQSSARFVLPREAVTWEERADGLEEVNVNRRALGDVIGEMEEAWENNTAGLQRKLNYPFAYFNSFPNLEVAERESVLNMIQQEAWAQAVSLYYTHPKRLQEAAPKTYDLVKEVSDAYTQNTPEQAHARIRAAFQSEARHVVAARVQSGRAQPSLESRVEEGRARPGATRPRRSAQAGATARQESRTDPGEVTAPNLGMAGIPTLFATAYHGSPHKFDRFDISRIGTGEGAAVFGHGLYLAENPQTAEVYAQNLGFTEIEDLGVGSIMLYRKGEAVDYSPRSTSDQDTAKALLQETMLANEWEIKQAFEREGAEGVANVMRRTVEDLKNSYAEEHPPYGDYFDRVARQIDQGVMKPKVKMQRNEYRYTVDVPDSAVEQMLDWDAPVTQQPPEVQQALQEAFGMTEETRGYWESRLEEDLAENGPMGYSDSRLSEAVDEYIAYGEYGEKFGSSIKDEIREAAPEVADEFFDVVEKQTAGGIDPNFSTGQSVYELIASAKGSPVVASEYLRQAGIPGIKYLDQGSRAQGEGTRNFVVFDDSIITILERNGEAVTGAEREQALMAMRPAAGRQSTGLTPAKARKALEKRLGKKAVAKGIDSGRLVLVANEDELRAHIGPYRDPGPGKVVRGLVHPDTGVAYLVTGNMTEGMVYPTLLHELGAHGMPEIVGRDYYDRILANLKKWNGRPDTPIGRIVAEAREKVPKNTPEAQVWDEVLAYLVENPSNHRYPTTLSGMVRALIAKIRAWATRRGWLDAESLSVDDVVEIAKGALKSNLRASEGIVVLGVDAQEPSVVQAEGPVDTLTRDTYTQLAGAARDLKQDQASGGDYLKALKRQEGVEADWLKWTGVDSWLKAQDGEVSRDQVVAFIENNGAHLEPATKTDVAPGADDYAAHAVMAGDTRVATLHTTQRTIGNFPGAYVVDALDMEQEGSAWRELALKRSLVHAAKRGADSVAVADRGVAGAVGRLTGLNPAPVTVDGRLAENESPDWWIVPLDETLREQILQRSYPLFAKNTDPWYSQMSRVLQTKLPARGTPVSMMGQIDGLAKKGEFRKEELEWAGLREWLAEQQGKVTREEVLAFLAENQIRVDEVMKGEVEAPSSQEIAERIERTGSYTVAGHTITKNEDGYELEKDGQSVTKDTIDDALEAIHGYLMVTGAEDSAFDELGGTKFAEYQLPGGENYRELLLTLPQKQKSSYIDVAQEMGYYVRDMEDVHRLPEADKTAVSREANRRSQQSPIFSGTHYDEPNVLAHVRFNDRVDADGNRVLFIEEIQDDWAKAARKAAAKMAISEGLEKGSEAFKARVSKLVKDYSNVGVPDRPFKGQAAYALAIKRMIRYASEQGYDKIAWTTAAQQITRYEDALRQNVDRIVWGHRQGEGKVVDIEGTVPLRLNVHPESGVVMDARPVRGNRSDVAEIVGKSIDDVVGRDVGRQILEKEKDDLSGEGLTVGGKGFQDVYDQMLPSVANKYAKKWGAKVAPIQVETLKKYGWEDPQTGRQKQKKAMAQVHALDINDAMRDDVLFNGLPLFAVSDRNAFNNFDTTSETTKDWLLRRTQDKFRRFKTLQRAIEEQTGKPLPDRRNVYQAEMLMYGRTEEDLVKIEEDYIEPLVKELAQSGLKIEQLDEYLEARHAPERNAHIQSINPEFEQGGAGMTDAEAAAIMKQAEQDGTVGQLERLAQMVDAMNERKLEVWEEAGLETAEYIAMLRENYEHYVPLKGFRDEDGAFQQSPGRGRGFDISGKETKRALGRRSRAASPVINSILDLEATFVRARKNEVGKNLVNLVHSHPNDNVWKVIKAPAIEMAKPRWDESRGEVVMAPDNLWWAKKEADDVLGVKIRGMQYYVHLKDPLLARAMKNLGEEKANGLVGLLGRLNRGLAMINTSLSPEFIVSNAARDIQTAMLNLLDEQDAHLLKDHKKIAAQTMKDLPKALKGAYRNLRSKEATDEWTRWMEEYRHAGGKVGFFGLVTLEQKRAKLLRMVKEGEGGIKGNAYKYFREFGNFVMDVNGAVENAARLAAYKNAREAGLSKAKAANLAKNLTVNFNKKGELGTSMNALYLFYNAALQGSARLIQGVVRSRKLQITMAGIAVGAFALAEMNRMIAGDDDDGENFYDKIPDWEKQRNFILMKPDGTYWKFPLPYGYNVPHVLGESINQMMHGKDVTQSAVHVIDTFLESFNPLGTEDSEQLGNRLLKMVSPTATDPWLSLALNENFYGAPIMPDNFPFGRQKPDSYLYFSTVSPMAKGAAQGLNALTGGNPARPGWIDVSPESIEHMMDFFTGSAGRFVRQTVELPAKVADPEPMKIKEIPFLRRFAGEQSEWTTNQRYWEHKEEIDALYYEREWLQEARRPTAEFDREYGRLLGLRRAFQNAEKKLRRLRKRKRTVQVDSTLDERTRQTIINNVDKQIERHQKAVNRRYNEIVEDME